MINNKNVLIRDTSQKDAELLALLIKKSFQDVALRFSLTPENCPKHPSNCTTDWITSDWQRGVQYFILSENGTPIGCVGLENPAPGTCYLERLAVLPVKRHHGFGKTLVLHALECARERGGQTVSIGIINEQIELKQWYSGLGFKEIEIKTFTHLPFQVNLMAFKIEVP